MEKGIKINRVYKVPCKSLSVPRLELYKLINVRKHYHTPIFQLQCMKSKKALSVVIKNSKKRKETFIRKPKIRLQIESKQDPSNPNNGDLATCVQMKETKVIVGKKKLREEILKGDEEILFSLNRSSEVSPIKVAGRHNVLGGREWSLRIRKSGIYRSAEFKAIAQRWIHITQCWHDQVQVSLCSHHPALAFTDTQP